MKSRSTQNTTEVFVQSGAAGEKEKGLNWFPVGEHLSIICLVAFPLSIQCWGAGQSLASMSSTMIFIHSCGDVPQGQSLQLRVPSMPSSSSSSVTFGRVCPAEATGSR